MPGGRYVACTVDCEGVVLKLSFQPKHLEKPLIDALIKPFIKAFNKKRAKNEQPEVAVDDVVSIKVKDETGSREFAGEKMETRFNAKTGDVLADYKGSMHDSVRWSDYHDSWAPAQGMVWDTDHFCSLVLRSADDVDASGLSLEDDEQPGGGQLALEDNSAASFTVPGFVP